MMKSKLLLAAILIGGITTVNAQTYKANVPASIQTPDIVKTELLGDLEFFDGLPSGETVKKVYDFLDVARSSEAFLNGIPAASIYGFLRGIKEAGAKPGDVIISQELTNARSLLLTPQTTTPYGFAEIDVKEEPQVVVVPPMILGGIDNAYFLHVGDVGLTGPDAGKGGKYLIVGPDYKGEINEKDYTAVYHTKTYRHWMFMRTFVKDGDIEASIQGLKNTFSIHPLSQDANPPKQKIVLVSGKQFNTIHANNFEFFEEINNVIQYEPANAFNPEFVGLLASIGIQKGEEFAPDARMKKLMVEGVAIGNATARSILFSPRNMDFYFYPDKRQWFSPFAFAKSNFLDRGARLIDSRIMFHYYATGITPAMSNPMVGKGSTYLAVVRDSKGEYLDGGNTYKVTLPAPVPAANFWSFMVYDSQTRSILETDQKTGGVDSKSPKLKVNKDGSYTVYFGPKAPKGQKGNWVQTMPGKGYNVLLRLYGPTEAWFDKSWIPGDFELVK